MSRTAELTAILLRRSWPASPVRLEELLTEAISAEEGADKPAAEQEASRYANRVWKYLFVDAVDRRPGSTPPFSVIDEERHILRPAWVASEESWRLTAIPSLIRWSDGLADEDFERCGAYACLASGASWAVKTQRTDDWGVDFLGLVPAYGRSHPFPSVDNNLRVVGQAKNGRNRVKRSVINEMITLLIDVAHRNEDVVRRFPPWFMSQPGPLVGCILAREGFQSGAISRARSHGIVLMDVIDWAEVAARDRAVDWSSGPPLVDAWADRVASVSAISSRELVS